MRTPSEVPKRSADRSLGLRGATLLCLQAMLGVGLFTAIAPAAAGAGEWLPLAVAIAAALAAINALAMVRLATHHRLSGGIYVYGREALGLPWGHLAGWAAVFGKTASVAALAMAVGVHILPDHTKLVAITTVVAVLALTLHDTSHPARLATAAVALLITLSALFAGVMFWAPPLAAEPAATVAESVTAAGVFQGAGMMFFAYVGFARAVTRRGEVRDLQTISRATALALTLVFALYLIIAAALMSSLGAGWVAAREAPIAEAAEISAWPWLGPAFRISTVLIAVGTLLALARGVSRVILAMADDHHFPAVLAIRDGPHQIPRRAQLAMAVTAILIIILTDLRGAIGYASFLILSYYAIANASAWTLDRRAHTRILPAVGCLLCVGLAVMLPWGSVAAGIVTLSLGAFIGWARWTTREDRPA